MKIRGDECLILGRGWWKSKVMNVWIQSGGDERLRWWMSGWWMSDNHICHIHDFIVITITIPKKGFRIQVLVLHNMSTHTYRKLALFQVSTGPHKTPLGPICPNFSTIPLAAKAISNTYMPYNHYYIHLNIWSKLWKRLPWWKWTSSQASKLR